MHAACTDVREKQETDDEIYEDENVVRDPVKTSLVVQKLQQCEIQTIIIDEAHHLRNEWWKSLIYLKDAIIKPHVVALTATPPYDVHPQEWKNYQQLCSSIDAEIPVPELVLQNNLCPHQDYVFLNSLSREENVQVSAFRSSTKKFLKGLKHGVSLVDAIREHPCMVEPKDHVQEILKNPAYYSSMAVFLRYT